MDFAYSEEEQAIYDLASQIISDKSTHERLREFSANDTRIDRELWGALGEAGVIGAALPEAHGGAGLGFQAVSAALEVAGQHAALVPLLETTTMASLPIAEFGTAEQQAAYLPGLASGALVGTAALTDARGTTTAVATDGGFALTGTKTTVSAGLDARVILVPALVDGQVKVFVVDPTGPGVTVTRQNTTTGRPQARLDFVDAAVAADHVLGGVQADGQVIVDWITLRADAGICALTVGLCQGSLELAAQYAKDRHQFDRPIATFQAVSQRAGDSYIDTEAVRLTARQAAWRIAAEVPAAEQVAIARYWAAEAGFRVVHAATHLHGGVGVDRDYPLHRHFLMARQLELTLGNAEQQLEHLGTRIAAS